MKTGNSNPKQVKILIALLVVAGISVGRMVLLWGRPAVPAAAANVAAATPARPGRVAARDLQRRRGVNLAPSDDPRLRLDLLKTSENTKYQGTGRNIFQPHMEEIPKPIVAANRPNAGPMVPQGPPPPPPINLKFFGFANRPGEPKKVFLVQGGDVFIAGEGDIVDRRYRVVRIQPFSVQIEDVLNNNRQTIPLQQS